MRHVATSRAFLFAATAAAALAAESSAPAPREDSINATKRDLDLIKSTRENMQPGAAVPKFSVPEMQTAPSPGAWTPKKQGVPEKKSATWLLDAMEKNSDSSKSRGKLELADLLGTKTREKDGETELELEPKDPRDAKAGRNLEPGERKSESSEEKNPRREEPVFNPLTRFMSDWMTPQDLALMKPVMEVRAGGELPGSGRVEHLALGNDVGLSATVESVLGTQSTATKSFVAPTAQENPYLQAMLSPLPVAGSGPAAGVAPAPLPPPAPSAAMAPLPALPAPKSNIPDFAKPAADEKYFKQLKRF
ncbi:MAG TPA: hypothetical protein VM029_23450 [Opitutaceae bacterium]|nr:hypothetical protein [Opitutaceae bacterium]